MAEQTQETLSLVVPITSRNTTLNGATPAKDSFLANGLGERQGQESADAVKRPGTTVYDDLHLVHTGLSHGLFSVDRIGGSNQPAEVVIAVIGNSVVRTDNNTIMNTISNYGSQMVYATSVPDNHVGYTHFTATLFHDDFFIYYIDNNTGLSDMRMYTLPQTKSAVVTISNASPAVVTWAGHGLSIGDAVQFTSTGTLPTGMLPGVTYYVMTAGFTPGAFQISTARGSVVAVNTSSAGSGTFTATLLGFDYSGADVFPSANPYARFVPGFVWIDGYAFILTTEGRLYNSDLNSHENFGPLNYTNVYPGPGPCTGLAKHLNYIVAFKESSLEFFYNNGNPPPGSPLNTYVAARTIIGTTNGQSLVNIPQSLIWVGESYTYGKSVYLFDGLQPTTISNRYIEKFLNADGCADIRAYCLKLSGHTLYVLKLMTAGVCLVYDLEEKNWYFWTSFNGSTEGIFNYSFGLYYDEVNPILLGNTDCILYRMDVNTYQDNGQPIYFRSVTPRTDFGSQRPKFMSKLEPDNDTVSGTLQVRLSTDDYQTWTAYRNVDLSIQKNGVYQWGTAQDIAFDFLYTGNTPCRISNVNLMLERGV